MSHHRATLVHVAAVVALVAARPLAAQREAAAAPRDTSCGRYVRNTGRAELCARIVDARTGRGVPGGGHGEFALADGKGSMSGLVRDDGEFGINAPSGRGTLTVHWSCRQRVVLVDTLTLPPGRGTEREYRVTLTAADTLCRVPPPDVTDRSSDAVARWMGRGPCFAIRAGPWRPKLGREYFPAEWVRLDTASGTSEPGARWYPMEDRGAPRASGWRYRGWRPLRGDSLELFWSTGFSAVTLTLGASGDTLAGHGIWTYDVIVFDSLGFVDRTGLPRGPASARRVDCR